jgi:hypothetical protein
VKLQTIKSKDMFPDVFRECIHELTKQSLPSPEPMYKHTFSNGLYVRELKLRKGSLAVGAVHKKETVAILAEGTLKLLTQQGLTTITGYRLIVSPPGTQRVVLALTDVVFLTLHRTDELTPDDVADEWIVGGHKVLIGERRIHEEYKHVDKKYIS